MTQKTQDDLGAYEIQLPDSFNIVKFNHDSELGNHELWLVKVEVRDNFYRYRGVKLPGYERMILDIDADNHVAYSPEPLEIVRELVRILGGTKLYKDGVEVPA
ncbi:MAG: hypothetical protein WC455_20065 [Dehalococcoidia bacterium]|jgi:hypothetical protein